MAEIKVYGAPWCPDCKRAKKFLAEHRQPYDWIDIDDDPDGRRFVEELQNGGRTIPTIIFPDGCHLLEASDEDLARKLGLKLEASPLLRPGRRRWRASGPGSGHLCRQGGDRFRGGRPQRVGRPGR